MGTSQKKAYLFVIKMYLIGESFFHGLDIFYINADVACKCVFVHDECDIAKS